MALQGLADPTRDALFNYDAAEQKQISSARPWKTDPHHFKYVRISAVALVKMVTHARSGGDLEIMGLMLGYVDHETFIITDAVRLPVEGTETRVNAQDEANEYIVQFLERSRQNGQLENAVGWYHSHPGYGCWLSGIDVGTQHAQQQFTDPFVAVVIDPHRTISAGKVDIGAFRTYPEGYKPDGHDTIADSTGAVPMAKAQDFGAHADRYYPLEVQHFKSSLDSKLLDALWNKYWVQTLSSSPLDTNQDYVTKQIEDLAAKTKLVHESAQRRTGIAGATAARKGNGRDEQMSKLVKAAEKIANEEKSGLLAAVVKDRIFSATVDTDVSGATVPAGVDTQMSEANTS
jgi:COP9 signalosome complex subunit 5